MIIYRKKESGSTWHWCENCSKWPKEKFESTYNKPDSDKMCKECNKKAERGKCDLGY